MYIIVRDSRDITLTLDHKGGWQLNPRKQKLFHTKEQCKKWLRGHWLDPNDTYRIVDLSTPTI